MLADARGEILKVVGAETLTGQFVSMLLKDVEEYMDDERRSWERTLSLVMDEDRDFEDYVI
jgi:hypothetical protein